MDARAVNAAPLSDPLVVLMRGAVGATAILLLLMACVLSARRLSGALEQPLSAPALLLVALLLAATATLLRWLWWPLVRRGTTTAWPLLAGLLLPGAALFLLAFSLSLPGSSAWALVALWAAVVAEEGGWWWAGWQRWSNRSASVRSGPAGRDLSASELDRERDGEPDPRWQENDEDEEAELGLPPEVSQRITRAREADGSEVIFALVRSDFAAGERSQHLHLAFCPPLTGQPDVTVDQLEGPACTIKPALVQSYGARLDLRLAAAQNEPASVVVQVFARLAAD